MHALASLWEVLLCCRWLPELHLLKSISVCLMRFTESLKGKSQCGRAGGGLRRSPRPPHGISSPYIAPDGIFMSLR